jgi:hypothetical protein
MVGKIVHKIDYLSPKVDVDFGSIIILGLYIGIFDFDLNNLIPIWVAGLRIIVHPYYWCGPPVNDSYQQGGNF